MVKKRKEREKDRDPVDVMGEGVGRRNFTANIVHQSTGNKQHKWCRETITKRTNEAKNH